MTIWLLGEVIEKQAEAEVREVERIRKAKVLAKKAALAALDRQMWRMGIPPDSSLSFRWLTRRFMHTAEEAAKKVYLEMSSAKLWLVKWRSRQSVHMSRLHEWVAERLKELAAHREHCRRLDAAGIRHAAGRAY